ncbi:TPA: hypothetical protein ACTXXA_002892 [Legionella anisa]
MSDEKLEKLKQDKKDADKSLVKPVTEELKEKNQKKYNDELEAARREHQLKWAAVMGELRKSHKTLNERTGKETTFWEEAMDLADHVINAEQTSINDWRSNMMSLLNLFAKLNKAINISSKQVAGEALNLIKGATHDKPIVRAITHPKEFMYEGVKHAILNKIKGNDKIDLPTLLHKVTFKDGKVDVAGLTRSDGISFENNRQQTANKAFNKFVDIWLMENEYVSGPNKDGSYVHCVSGEPLTQDKFNELNTTPQTSLEKFLEDSATFKFKAQEENDMHSGPNPIPG